MTTFYDRYDQNNTKTTYTIHDILAREYNVEPLQCLFCNSLEVEYDSFMHDAYCSECGTWQLEKLHEMEE